MTLTTLTANAKLSTRYTFIALVYTFHAGKAFRRVWDNHGMTDRTLHAGYQVVKYTIALALFVNWFLNESTWSKDTMTPEDNCPTIEDIERQLVTVMGELPLVTKLESPEPIDNGTFVERYTRYNMDSHGMPEPTPDMSWTKPDLVKACRCYGLKTTGNKAQLLERLTARV